MLGNQTKPSKFMARQLTFKIGNDAFDVTPVKVERRKIYGRSELRVTDAAGNVCRQCGINNDGTTMVEQGCVKSGILTLEGMWTDKAELIAVDKDGRPLTQIQSSFDDEIILQETATVEDLLNLKVLSVYQLADVDAALIATVGDEIYAFPFSYSGGYEYLKAYLLVSGGALYIIAGTPCTFEYLPLNQSGEIDMDVDAEVDDELDFSMF